MRLPNLTSPSVLRLSVDFTGPVDYLIFIYHILFATAAILVAGPLVIAILSTRALWLQNRFIFMLNTSICDTLVGLSVYYLGLVDVFEGYPPRNATYYVLPSLLGVNIMVFLFAQIDRYFAVCQPFVYTRFVSRELVIALNVYCWVHISVHLLMSNNLSPYRSMQMHVFTIICLQVIVFIMVVMTIKLFLVARYQLARDPPSVERENSKESLRIIVFVVISFLVLWSPSFVNIILRLLVGGGSGVVFRNEATNLFAIMARLNALCTPGVYLWGSPALRKALVRTVWGRACPRCRRRLRSAKVQGKESSSKTH